MSERLRSIGNRFGLCTWFTYPGRSMDMFTRFRGRVHASKAQDVVYWTECTCGVAYIGETNRNLKVRLVEHLRRSSSSAFTAHIKPDNWNKSTSSIQSNQHQPALRNTVIMACESNNFKRKLLESICIACKAPRLCNTGPSIDMPTVWNACQSHVAKELERFD